MLCGLVTESGVPCNNFQGWLRTYLQREMFIFNSFLKDFSEILSLYPSMWCGKPLHLLEDIWFKSLACYY